jgi:hypothetical protein
MGDDLPEAAHYVVSLNGVTPPARFDGKPWAKAIIFEAEAELFYAGEEVWSKIDEVELASLPGGLDTNPESPRARSFTTNKATLAEGYYYFIWQDEEGGESGPSKIVHNVFSVEQTVRPSLAEVAAVIRTRTVELESGGKEAGTFNTKTKPTAEEAEGLINAALAQTLLTTGPEISPSYWERARTVVAYLAACLIEFSYYREDIERDTSAFPELEKMHKQALDGLLSSISGTTPGSPTQSFFSVPIETKNQARFRALMQAFNPKTGRLDPSKLPPDQNWPLGPGGLPPWFLESANSWPNLLDLGGFWSGSDSFLDEY